MCEFLSFAEQAVEDGAEVAKQPLGVLQQLQRLRVGEVGRAVEQRSAWRPNRNMDEREIRILCCADIS